MQTNLQNLKLNNEIFRHLRPLWYDKNKHELVPQSNGGISFLLVPTELGTYNYWIYFCPLNVSFSTKQAVKVLRNIYNKGVVNIGAIIINQNEPLIHQLIKDVMSENFVLPSDMAKLVLSIIIINSAQENKKQKIQQSISNTRNQYAAS